MLSDDQAVNEAENNFQFSIQTTLLKVRKNFSLQQPFGQHDECQEFKICISCCSF